MIKEKFGKNDKNKVPDSLLYPPCKNIDSQFKKELNTDPEDISKNKVPVDINTVRE